MNACTVVLRKRSDLPGLTLGIFGWRNPAACFRNVGVKSLLLPKPVVGSIPRAEFAGPIRPSAQTSFSPLSKRPVPPSPSRTPRQHVAPYRIAHLIFRHL